MVNLRIERVEMYWNKYIHFSTLSSAFRQFIFPKQVGANILHSLLDTFPRS